ncbi:MAG TPA: MBL fold metallo-hydrolase [bacterium]|nr:MBL fold metallo-hydrolase [bacterium]
MVEAYQVEREPERPKEVKKSNKGFFSLVIILLLLASSLWGLALNANWRQALYPSFKEASLPSSVETKEKAYQPPEKLTVTLLDVGQGLSFLIETPEGRVIMYDAGEGANPDFKFKRYFDAGARVILPILEKKGIKRIDTIAVTGPDSDHMGGFITILNEDRLEIGEVWDIAFPKPTPTYKAFLDPINRRGIKFRLARRGQVLDWGEDVFAQILHPDNLYSSSNNSSIVIKLVYGKVSFLFTGDIEKEAERELVETYGPGLESTFLQVGHHGSNTSSTPLFLDFVKPKVALIGVGRYNTYGHPTPKTLKKLRERGIEIYRTDQDGHVVITTDGKDYEVIRTGELTD